LQGISAEENLPGDNPVEHLDGEESVEVSTAEDVFVTAELSIGISLVCSLEIPLHCSGIVLRNTLTIVI